MLILSPSPAVLAADDLLKMDNGQVLHVKTNTAGGKCSTEEIVELDSSTTPPTQKAVKRLDCTDAEAGSSASANSSLSCIEITGAGLCAVTVPEIPVAANASRSVNCPGSVSYNISAGDPRVRCTVTGSGASRIGNCTALHNSANADCKDGCGNTAGSGRCCQSGPGCTAGYGPPIATQ